MGFADDSQLYASFRPGVESTEDQTIAAMEACIRDVRLWMLHNKLKINDSKSEFMLVGSKQLLQKVNTVSIKVGDSEVVTSEGVRNLGIWLDKNLSMTDHVSRLCRSCYYNLHNIRAIRKCLSETATHTIIHAFITSKLDYGNATLYGISQENLHRLQRVQNTAARVIKILPKYCHITPHLKDLHWLPVGHRIVYKIAILVHKGLHGRTPTYISELLTYVSRPERSHRSNNQRLLVVPCTSRKSFGDRAFCVTGPKIWNSLPLEIRNIIDFTIFKQKLKTHLFNDYFNFSV
jgi:hypothetical protein